MYSLIIFFIGQLGHIFHMFLILVAMKYIIYLDCKVFNNFFCMYKNATSTSFLINILIPRFLKAIFFSTLALFFYGAKAPLGLAHVMCNDVD